MKKPFQLTILGFSFFFLIIGCNSVSEKTKDIASVESIVDVVGYDSLTAQAYGADDYGMKRYVIAFLKRGPNREMDKDKAAELQKAHLNNISKMADEGKLVVAGPFLEEGDLRGIYIFNVATKAEAEVLTNSDPAVQAGSLEMELMEWYGTAALMALKDLHKTLSKKSITDN